MPLHKLKALIFDVDGTLIHSERDGHFPACNDAFRELQLPVEWDWPTFKSMLQIPGNANRLRHWLTTKLHWPKEQVEHAVQQFEPLKKKIYIERYLPQLPLRTGVEAILKEAIANGVRLAIVSTTYESQIHALLDNQLKAYQSHFEIVLGKESGPKTGKEGILYSKCRDMLGLPEENILVIEDSQAGMEAALGARIPVAVFYNDVTWGENFTGARLVARSLAYFNLATLEGLCL